MKYNMSIMTFSILYVNASSLSLSPTNKNNMRYIEVAEIIRQVSMLLAAKREIRI